MFLLRPKHSYNAPKKIVERKSLTIFHSETNWIVMDYLVSEGYPGAAEKFAEETNIDLPSAPQKIRERVLIRNALHAGRVEDAVCLINEIDHQVCLCTLLAHSLASNDY
jgi:hypothetical protein